MKTRTLVTLLLALVLVVLVMLVSVVVTFTGWVDQTKIESQTVAQYGYGGAQNMKIMDLTGDGQNDLFVQDSRRLALLNAAGQPLLEQVYGSTLVTSMGDVNGDGVEDVLAFVVDSGGSPVLDVFVKGELVAQYPIAGMGTPARVAVLQFSGGPQIILGDDRGRLLSLNALGQELWRGQIGSGEVRGLDDARIDGQAFLAVANRDGQVALLDERGQVLWPYTVGGGLRRMRAYDLNGDGAGEVLLGGESGDYIVLDARSGTAIASDRAGQPVSEIRALELNGEPGSLEVVAGGKNGGVWAYTWDGKRLWSASVADKVNEIAGLDLDRDGAEEALIGDESGEVYLFSGDTGERQQLLSMNGAVTRIDVGALTASRQVAISDAGSLKIYTFEMQSVPALQFTPLLVGLIASVVILAAAWFIATNPPKPKLQVAIEDQSAESLRAQRRMLKESIADVERLKATGEVSPEAYLRRMKDLRAQLAANETAMRTAGVVFTPETFQCPHCGGSLLLGVDKCDYCGQVVIT